MTQEQRAVIRGCCAERPGKAKGYKRSLMGRSHRPRGEFNRRSRGGERSGFLSLFLISVQSSLTRDGLAVLREELWHSGQGEQPGRDESCPVLEQPNVSQLSSSLVPDELSVMGYQFCGVITHPSPKAMALIEVPLALKPLLELTPHKACSQEDTFHWRINCIKLWLPFS